MEKRVEGVDGGRWTGGPRTDDESVRSAEAGEGPRARARHEGRGPLPLSVPLAQNRTGQTRRERVSNRRRRRTNAKRGRGREGRYKSERKSSSNPLPLPGIQLRGGYMSSSPSALARSPARPPVPSVRGAQGGRGALLPSVATRDLVGAVVGRSVAGCVADIPVCAQASGQ